MGTTNSIPDAPPLLAPADKASEPVQVTSPALPLPTEASPLLPVAPVEEVSPEPKDKTLVIHNLTKRPITYWCGEECGILVHDETMGPLVMPVHIFPAKVAVRPTSTPRFYLEGDVMFADNIENTNSAMGHFRSVSATVTFTVESFKDYYKVTVNPSVAVA